MSSARTTSRRVWAAVAAAGLVVTLAPTALATGGGDVTLTSFSTAPAWGSTNLSHDHAYRQTVHFGDSAVISSVDFYQTQVYTNGQSLTTDVAVEVRIENDPGDWTLVERADFDDFTFHVTDGFNGNVGPQDPDRWVRFDLEPFSVRPGASVSFTITVPELGSYMDDPWDQEMCTRAPGAPGCDELPRTIGFATSHMGSGLSGTWEAGGAWHQWDEALWLRVHGPQSNVPPTPIPTLHATPGGGFKLTWDMGGGANTYGVSYRIYRDGRWIGVTRASEYQVPDDLLDRGTAHQWAVDAGRGEARSPLSTPVPIFGPEKPGSANLSRDTITQTIQSDDNAYVLFTMAALRAESLNLDSTGCEPSGSASSTLVDAANRFWELRSITDAVSYSPGFVSTVEERYGEGVLSSITDLLSKAYANGDWRAVLAAPPSDLSTHEMMPGFEATVAHDFEAQFMLDMCL